MTAPSIGNWCMIHGGYREYCGCLEPSAPFGMRKCVDCGSPTAAPIEHDGKWYCQEHGTERQSVWGVWVVYDWDMNYHISAIFPDELEARRYAGDAGYYLRVKRVTAGDLTEQLK